VFAIALASSTLCSSIEGCGDPVKCDGLAAQGTGAEDDGEHELQLVLDLDSVIPAQGLLGPS
jgi:hypothetical protein